MDKRTCAALLALWAAPSYAALITIDPDDYAAGTALTGISPHVTIDTTGGGTVYAAPIAGTGRVLPPDIADTGPFGERVFSRQADRNSEWLTFPDDAGVSTDPYDPAEWAKDPNALRLTFTESVSSISLLGLELFDDAGSGDDPLRWWIYDSAGALLFTGFEDTIPGDGSLGVNSEFGFNYYFWNLDFSNPDIRTVIIGGETEPTTLDRLTFKTASIPEPGTLLLLSTSLLGLAYFRRKAVR